MVCVKLWILDETVAIFKIKLDVLRAVLMRDVLKYEIRAVLMRDVLKYEIRAVLMRDVLKYEIRAVKIKI